MMHENISLVEFHDVDKVTRRMYNEIMENHDWRML